MTQCISVEQTNTSKQPATFIIIIMMLENHDLVIRCCQSSHLRSHVSSSAI
jgi:hypothetical protein